MDTSKLHIEARRARDQEMARLIGVACRAIIKFFKDHAPKPRKSNLELFLSQARDVYELEHLQRAWERKHFNGIH